jgi:ABC-type transporter Mla subunit MlaD
VLAAAVLLGGCGGDDGDGAESSAPPPGPALTKAEYEQAYRATRADNDETRAELRKVFETTDPDETGEIAEALRTFATEARADAKTLDALRPPADIAGEHQDYVDLVNRIADTYDDGAQQVDDAGNADEARNALLPLLQKLFTNERNQLAARDFLKAVDDGGYDLGPGLPGEILPEGGAP